MTERRGISRLLSVFDRRLQKKMARRAALVLGMVSDNVEVERCPVCFHEVVEKSFPHKEWLKQCYTCASCRHSFLPDPNNQVPEGYFITYPPRARLYAGIISSLDISSVLEVGTPDDFLFLELLHEARPDIKLYGHDIFAKDNVPDYVNMVHDLAESDADLVYASHVLEHFTDPHEFGQFLKEKRCKFIIEVPNCPASYRDLINNTGHGTGYHYQFFNTKSLSQLLSHHGLRSFTFVRSDPDMKRNIRGSLTSSNIDYDWGPLIHEQYDIVNQMQAGTVIPNAT